MDLELSEQARADTDDHGQHQNLDAGGHHVAQDLFGEERGLVPEREWHQHESGERGQLELDQRDEQLDRQHEEAQDHDQPREEHHHDGVEVHEHFGKARHLADLLQNRRPGVDAGFASRPGCKKFSIVMAEPVAVMPNPANERNTMLASQLKLLMM